MSTCLAECLDNIENAVALSCTKIVDLNTRIFFDLVDSLNMSYCQIHNMNIVSYTCSVRCIVVIAEYTKTLKLTDGNLSHIWKKVVRDTLWILTHKSTLMCSDRVEVTKKNYIPLRICCVKVCKNLFNHPLCPAVWICRCSLWTLLCDRDKCRISVYCGR